MKGTIGAMAMFWALAASAAAPAESVPQDGRTTSEERPLFGLAIRPVVEVEAVGGRRELSEPAFRGLSQQSEVGVRLTVTRDADSRFGLATDYLESRASKHAEGYTLGAITRELGLGVRGKIDGGRVNAVAACGVALLRTELAATYAVRTWRIKEEGVGGWYSLGIRVPVTSRVTAGADVRHTIGVVSGRGHSSSVDGFHIAGSLGVRIGAVSKGRIGMWGSL